MKQDFKAELDEDIKEVQDEFKRYEDMAEEDF